MKLISTPIIHTKRLILRRFTMSDAPYIFKNWASDSEVTKYLSWKTHESEGDAIQFVNYIQEKYKNQYINEWAIELKSISEPIGALRLSEYKDTTKSMTVGYCIGRPWWHQGIASEALKAVIDYGFNIIGLERIEADHDSRNPNSGKVMLGCGMSYRGMLRKEFYSNAGIGDTCIYDIIKDDLNNMKNNKAEVF